MVRVWLNKVIDILVKSTRQKQWQDYTYFSNKYLLVRGLLLHIYFKSLRRLDTDGGATAYNALYII
jgi:hypothetical protein